MTAKFRLSQPCGCRVRFDERLTHEYRMDDSHEWTTCPLHKAAPKLRAALEEAQIALFSTILFIEGAFPEPSDTLKQELTSYRMRNLKAKQAIKIARAS